MSLDCPINFRDPMSLLFDGGKLGIICLMTCPFTDMLDALWTRSTLQAVCPPTHVYTPRIDFMSINTLETTVLYMTGYWLTTFYLTDVFTKLCSPRGMFQALHGLHPNFLVLGAMLGSSILTYPLDTIRREQMLCGQSMSSTLRNILDRNGGRGLMAGVAFEIARSMSMFGIRWLLRTYVTSPSVLHHRAVRKRNRKPYPHHRVLLWKIAGGCMLLGPCLVPLVRRWNANRQSSRV